MTFVSFEGSSESGRPIEVYKFSIAGTEYRYTSSSVAVTVDSQVYEPLAMKRNQMLQSSDRRSGTVDIQVPGGNEFARLFISVVPAKQVVMTVRRFHPDDLPNPEVVGLFSGKVKLVKFSANGMLATISARPDIAAAAREWPFYKHTGGCNNDLYDHECQVSETDPAFRAFDFTVTAVSADGRDITVPGLASGYASEWFTGGFVELVTPNDLRLVLSQAGDVLTMLLPFGESIVGRKVNVFAGCAHDVTDCSVKFLNYANYGGDPYGPKLNPFLTGIT